MGFWGIGAFLDEIKPYFFLGDRFGNEFDDDVINQGMYNYSESLPLAYDHAFSEDLENVTDIFRLRAIWNTRDTKQTWEYFDYTNAVNTEDFDEQKMKQAYQKIVNEYLEANNAEKRFQNEIERVFPNVNAISIVPAEDSTKGMEYALLDIDGNGIEEIIFGFQSTPEEYVIADIYSYDGSQARKLLDDDTIAESSKLRIYKDGTMYKYSPGNTYNGAYFYRMNDNGYSVNLLEKYIADWENYPETPYYRGEEFLSEEKFKEKLKEFGEEVTFSWKSITEAIAEVDELSAENPSEEKSKEVWEDDGMNLSQLSGVWSVDVEKTHGMNSSSLRDEFGSGIKEGNKLEISEAGKFSYYIGIGYGGAGTCAVSDNQIKALIISYEEGVEQEFQISIEEENGKTYLIMDHFGYMLCWCKE